MDVRRMRNEALGKRVVKALESRNMEAYYASTKEEAVQKALELMKNGKLPLHEISWQCGIGDYKYFNTVFRKYLGCGPKEYMAQIGGWLK